MREDHEEVILRNPAFGAGAFWYLARSFSDHSEGGTPMLAHFVLAEGMLFHARTVQKIRNMNLDSGLLKAISDVPDIVAGLQGRVEESVEEALHALQVGTATGILTREHAGAPTGGWTRRSPLRSGWARGLPWKACLCCSTGWEFDSDETADTRDHHLARGHPSRPASDIPRSRQD
jgi:hypothetical protein